MKMHTFRLFYLPWKLVVDIDKCVNALTAEKRDAWSFSLIELADRECAKITGMLNEIN